MHDEVKDEFKLPDICINKYKTNSEKEKELIDSVANGDIKNVYNLLWNENVSVNVKKDFYGTDLLTIATQNEHNDLVKLLMKMNLSPKTRNSYGVTPIHWAANNGNDYLIQELCKHGITVRDLEKRDEFGSTPLHFAAMQNNDTIVQLLISSGINPTVINNDGQRASDVTTDIAIKKFLKDEETRYYAEHNKKKGKKKGKKKKDKVKMQKSESTVSKKPPSAQSSMVKSTSKVKPVLTKSNSTKRVPTPPKKPKKPSILPPTINNSKPIVSNNNNDEAKVEKAVLNTTSYAMKNFNQEVMSIDTKTSPKGSNNKIYK